MKGIRKKINAGFMVLIVLLMFSGMVSLVELDRLSKRTQTMLESSYTHLDLSKRMLDAVERQNSSLLHAVMFGQAGSDSTFTAAGRDFDEALRGVSEIEDIEAVFDSIVVARDRFREHAPRLLDEEAKADIELLLADYKAIYQSLTRAIKEYMTASQHSIISRTAQLEHNAYRAIMPGVITLVVAIIIVLVFMFMIDFYFTRPVVRIQKGLENSLRHNIPFRIKTEGNDEVAALGDSVDKVMSILRKKQNE